MEKIEDTRIVTLAVDLDAWARVNGLVTESESARDFREYVTNAAHLGFGIREAMGTLREAGGTVTVTDPAQPPLLTRDDEAGFRTAVPREINGLEVLQVSGYKPGGKATLPGAIVVCQHEGEYSTHRLVYADDHPNGPRWIVRDGEYGYLTREDAMVDAASREA